MDDESQLTLTEAVDESVPRTLYTAISSLADALVAADRERAGDNCATVSQRYTETDETIVFCIQLPPRTNTVSITDFPKQTDSDLALEFSKSTVRLSKTPEEVVWEFTGSHPDAEQLRVVIVKPVESVPKSNDEEVVQNRDVYQEFDFTSFVHTQTE